MAIRLCHLERAPCQGLDGCLMCIDLVLKLEVGVVDAEDVVVAPTRELPSAVGPLEAADLLHDEEIGEQR